MLKHNMVSHGETHTKQCNKCGIVKPLTEFYKHTTTVDGYRHFCKCCSRNHSKKWTKENPFSKMLLGAKTRAKKKGLDFNIDLDYLKSIDRDTCPYLNIPIEWGNKVKDFTKSLDRIDSSRGYVKGNLIICSHRANTILSNATATEMLTITSNYFKVLNHSQNQNETN